MLIKENLILLINKQLQSKTDYKYINNIKQHINKKCFFYKIVYKQKYRTLIQLCINS